VTSNANRDSAPLGASSGESTPSTETVQQSSTIGPAPPDSSNGSGAPTKTSIFHRVISLVVIASPLIYFLPSTQTCVLVTGMIVFELYGEHGTSR